MKLEALHGWMLRVLGAGELTSSEATWSRMGFLRPRMYTFFAPLVANALVMKRPRPWWRFL